MVYKLLLLATAFGILTCFHVTSLDKNCQVVHDSSQKSDQLFKCTRSLLEIVFDLYYWRSLSLSCPSDEYQLYVGTNKHTLRSWDPTARQVPFPVDLEVYYGLKLPNGGKCTLQETRRYSVDLVGVAVCGVILLVFAPELAQHSLFQALVMTGIFALAIAAVVTDLKAREEQAILKDSWEEINAIFQGGTRRSRINADCLFLPLSLVYLFFWFFFTSKDPQFIQKLSGSVRVLSVAMIVCSTIPVHEVVSRYPIYKVVRKYVGDSLGSQWEEPA